jgi:hypothetical protein
MSDPTPPPAVPATPVPPPSSAPARVVGTFFSPTATFQSIAVKPGFILPLLLWTAVSLLITNLMLPKFDYERMTRARMEKSGTTVPEERMQEIIAQQKKIGPIFGNVFGAISPLVVCLLSTLVFWGGFKAFGWDLTFKQGFGVSTHAYLPGVLGALVLIPVMSSRETIDPQAVGDLLRSNLGFLVDQSSSPVIHSLLQSVDLFSIWTIFLLTVGYSAAARIPRKSAGGLIVGIWVIFVLCKAGIAAVFH